MQRLLALIIKEFKQILRDRTNLGIIFVVPFVQLLILGSAITMDVTALKTVIIDHDHSVMSRDIIRAFSSNKIFHIIGQSDSSSKAVRMLDMDRAKVAIVIPQYFQRDVLLQRNPAVQVLLDGVDGNGSSIASSYALRILQEQEKNWRQEYQLPIIGSRVQLETRMLFNAQLESKYNIVPGIIAILLTMITVFLTAINIVREKEVGTLEQLSVTPIRKYELILGKIIPMALMGLLLFTVGIIAAAVIFHVYCAGNLCLLYVLAVIYMFTTLGLGIFFSTVSQTQQQAMFFAWFFAIFSIMLSGFFVPIENMPDIIQWITYLNPTRYFIYVMRGIFLKAAGLDVLWEQAVALIVFGITVLSLAIARFQKRLS